MSETEHHSFEVFWKKHQKKCKPKNGALLRITACGIGTAFVVVCSECNKEKDITEYGCW